MKQIYVTRTSMPLKEEYFNEIEELWDSHILTNMGKKHNELQEKLKSFLKVEEVSLFCNGHMALELLLQALDLHGEVITTPFTFASTTHAIVRNGLMPVFCDIKDNDYTIDADKIESLITEKTCAILPVHVYGNICDVEKIDLIAKKHKLKVIYDAAHAFGVEYKGHGIAEYGDASMLSFHATKVFNTIEGGAVCCRNMDTVRKLYQLKNFGIQSEELVDGIGANAKMNEFQAAMGICNLRHVEDEIAKRKRVYERYMNNLSGVKGIILQDEQRDVKRNYAYFPVLFVGGEAVRNKVFESLIAKGIYPRKYFSPLTSEYQCYKGRFDVTKTPVALKVSKQILTLPIYADLDRTDVDYICESIKQSLYED